MQASYLSYLPFSPPAFPTFSINFFPAMLSAFPAMMSADGLFGNPFPPFEAGFTPWECQEPPFVFPHHDEPILSPLEPQEPVIYNSGSDYSNPTPFDSTSGSGYDEPNQNNNSVPVEPQEPVIFESGSEICNPTPLVSISGSGSEEPNQNNKRTHSCSDDSTNPPVVDDRKRRRMLSNRESARRSRMRKQRHLENLRSQVNRLRIENRELMNRLRVVTQHCQVERSDNDRLRSESIMLRQRLWDIRQVLLVRQLQQQLAAPCMAMQ